MEVVVMRGNKVICSSSDEQITMEEVNSIRKKERMTDKRSTLSVYVYDPNKEEKKSNPIKISQDKEEVIEKAKVIAAGGVPEEKTAVINTAPEEDTAEEVVDKPVEEATVDSTEDEEEVNEVSEEVDEGIEETPVEEDHTEFNVKSKFTSDDSNKKKSDEELINEIIPKVVAKSKEPDIVSEFFAKEARDEKLYGKTNNKNFKQPRNNRGNRKGKVEEY